MKVTFIYHSCYVVELSDKVLIFDYYKGVLPPLPIDKKIYFFVSHSHYDHFNEEILDMYPDNEKIYIFSSDCFMVNNEIRYTMLNEDKLTINDVNIRTIPSNDLGVAYIIHTNGMCFYHAGDLNAWCFTEDGKKNCRANAKQYMEHLEKINHEDIDVAFIPLDARLKRNAEFGIDIFTDYASPKIIFPMHMHDPDYNIVRLYMYGHNGFSRMAPVLSEGYVFECEGDTIDSRWQLCLNG